MRQQKSAKRDLERYFTDGSKPIFAAHKGGRDCGRTLTKSAKFEPLLTRSSPGVFVLMDYD